MKLLKTIQRIVKEAEDIYYNASLTSTDPVEIKILEKKLEDSQQLLEIFESVENKEEEE